MADERRRKYSGGRFVPRGQATEIVSVMESGVPVRVQEWAEMPRDQRGHTHQWNFRFQRAYLSLMEDNHMQDEVTIQGSKME